MAEEAGENDMANSPEADENSQKALSGLDGITEAISEQAQKGSAAVQEEIQKLLDGLKETNDSQAAVYEKVLKLEGSFKNALQDILDNDGKPKTEDGKKVQNSIEGNAKVVAREGTKNIQWLETKYGKMAKWILAITLLVGAGNGVLLSNFNNKPQTKCFMIKSCDSGTNTGVFVDLPCDQSTCSCSTIQQCQPGLPVCDQTDSGCAHYYYMQYTLNDISTVLPGLPKIIWDANNQTTSKTEIIIRVSIFLFISIGSIVGAYAFYKWFVRSFNPPD